MLPPSTTSCPGKWHDSQAAIDKQITAYESAILELRTRRNDYAPISELPAELLEEIFVLAKLLPTRQFSYGSPDDRGWLNVAHVCRNWRKIALNAPRMWNQLNVSRIKHLDWAITSLTHSQRAPLHVTCTDSDSDWAILSVILVHTDRIQHLDIISQSRDNSTVLLKIIEAIVIGAKGSASVLQSLHLRTRIPLSSASDAVCEGIHRIFGLVQMPCLQTLEVKGFTVPPTIPIFSQLRQLSYTLPRDIEPSVSSILSILRSTPFLKRLDIGSPLITSNEVIDESTTLELSELSSLSYTTTQLKGSSLFRQIRYPHSVRVKFTSRIPDRDGRIASCIEDLKAIASNDNMTSIDDMSVCSINGTSFMRVSDRHGRVLDLDLDLANQDVLPLFDLFLVLPRSQARTFFVSGFHQIDKEGWETLFGRHEQVQKLVTEGVNSSCIEALLKSPAAEQPPFAQLKTLHLYHFNVELNVALVVQVLEERKRLGSPIDLLEIWECRVTEDAIQQLDGLVQVGGDFSKIFYQVSQAASDEENNSEDESDTNEDEN